MAAAAPDRATQPPRPPRVFFVEDILAGRVSFQGYPFRHLCITSSRTAAVGAGFSGRAGFNSLIDQLLSAVELMEGWGWELVNIDQGGILACLRRRAS